MYLVVVCFQLHSLKSQFKQSISFLNLDIFRETVNQLGSTVQEVDKLQGKVRQSLKEMKIFLNGMGTVAANAVKELNNLKLK